MSCTKRFRAILALITAVAASTPAPAADTGSNHNLFVLHQLDDHSFFVGRANLN